MKRILYGVLTCLLCFAFVPAHAASVQVDCDAGDELGEVLKRAAASRNPAEPLEIFVSGTCIGNFRIASSGISLIGTGPDPESTVLRGAAPKTSVTPVVEVRYAQDVLMDNLTVTGGSIGVRLLQSEVLVRDCRLLGNGTGISSESSQTWIEDSVLAQNRDGIQSLAADLLLLDGCSVIDNEQIGVFAIGGSSLTVDAGEIRDNLFGLYVLDNASAFLRQGLVIGATLGGAHVSAINHSTVTINDGVTIEGGNAIEIVNQSVLQAFDSPIEADLKLIQSGRAFLDETQLDGFVTLERFSQAVLSASVTGEVVCDRTSDADCEGGTVGAVFDCGSCETVSAPATRPGGASGSDRGGTIFSSVHPESE